MAHFKRITSTPPHPDKTNAVIMGRKTWESIPPKFRPLDNRTNVILTRSNNSVPGVDADANANDPNSNVMVCTSLQQAVEKLQGMPSVGNVFIIGGGQVYEESIKSGLVNKVFYTEVSNLPADTETEFDTWFPELAGDDWECHPFPGQELELDSEKEGEDDVSARAKTVVKTDKKTGVTYQFLEYKRNSLEKQTVSEEEEKAAAPVLTAVIDIEEGAHVNPEEMQYLEMCRDIIENGVQRGDRTGTGTLSKFGTQMRFSLRDGTLPLLTTKRTFWRGVAEELLWFVKVSKDTTMLLEIKSLYF